jgi:hypothetical protein
MTEVSFLENQLQDWFYDRLANGALVDSIVNLDESLQIARAYRKDPFVSDLNGFLFSMAKARWAEAVETIARWYSPAKEVSVAKTGGRPLQIDVLGRKSQLGEFVIIELKRAKSTERQAITELAAYTNALSSIFPTLPPRQVSLAVVATNWDSLLANALTLLLVFHRYNIVGFRVEAANADKTDFVLRIVDFTKLGFVKPEIVELEHIDYLCLEVRPEQLPPLTALQEITRHIRRLELNGFCTVLSKNDETAVIGVFLLNPYKFTQSFLDLVDERLLLSVLGLSDGCTRSGIVQNLAELARSWSSQLTELFDPFRALVENIAEVDLSRAQLKGTLKLFFESDYREYSVGEVQFVGLLEDFATAWRSSHIASDLLPMWYGNLSGKQKLALLLGMPDINLFILSEFVNIGEFRYGLVSLLNVFRFGRRLGRLVNCAFFGTEAEYDRERQIFQISLTRCPFRVYIDLTNRTTLQKTCEAACGEMRKKIVESGDLFLYHLFMLGELVEQKYDSMARKEKDNSKFRFIVPDIDTWIDDVLNAILHQELPHPDLASVWNCLEEHREQVLLPQSSNQLLAFLNDLEHILKTVDECVSIRWFYKEKRAKLTIEERQIARRLLQAHSTNIEFPMMYAAPNGDISVLNMDTVVKQDEEIRTLWESVDHSKEFILFDGGEGFGTMLAVPYEDPSGDYVLRTFSLDANISLT